MAKLGIFTGTSANDTTGDTLAQGALKINSNFSEIYTALGDGTNITNSLSSITVAGLSTFTSGPVVIGSGIQTGTSKLQVSGNTFITGSVGIGTTNPTSKLTVVGNIKAGYEAATGIVLGITPVGVPINDNNSYILWGDDATFGGANGDLIYISRTSTNTSHRFYTGTTTPQERFRITSTGNVGIGTNDPTSKLHVAGDVRITGVSTLGVTTATNLTSQQLQVTGISTFTNGPVLIGGGTSTGTSGQILQVTGISSGAYIGGSVGIGTTNPQYKLHVVGDVKVTGTITGSFSGTLTDATIATNVIGGIGSITQLQVTGISTFTNGPVLVGRATTTGTANQALQVESGAYFNGSIGIGTTNPAEKLSVFGAVESLYDTIGEGGQFVLRGKTGTPIRWNIDNYSVGVTTNLFRIFKEDNSTAGANGRVYVGITTIGEFIIGDGAGAVLPTKTANQQLQVQSGAYIQNNLGIGTTNPTSSLSVNGSTVIGTEILNMTDLSSTFSSSDTFTVPTGVTKISAVLIGGGGAGGGSNGGAGGNGGGGGGLVYINDYAVSPGQNLTVVVGGGGVAVSNSAGGDGGNSSITGVATAFGGKGGAATASDNGSLGGSGESNFVNSGISTGGPSGKGTNTTGGGGGGSAGYSGNGGSGGTTAGTPSGAGSGGGAGGGSEGNGTNGGNGGGGTGILGQGSSGESGGGGGSGGANGITASSTTGSNGGNYGGGGGGADGNTGSSQSGGNGAQGIVRIIWSPSSKFSRLFPTNQVGNNINQ